MMSNAQNPLEGQFQKGSFIGSFPTLLLFTSHNREIGFFDLSNVGVKKKWYFLPILIPKSALRNLKSTLESLSTRHLLY